MIKHDKIKQGSDEWHHIRKGKVTGTTLKSIMGTPRAYQDAIYEIVAERLTIGTDIQNEDPRERGKRLEGDGVSAVEFQLGKKITTTGFCEDDTNSLIANSPDGLINTNEAVEIKCPEGKNYVKMWLTNKIPDEYYWQAIQYFIVNEKLKILHFAGYNPDIPRHPLHIITLKRKDIKQEILQARKKQEEFIEKVEEILSKIIKL